MHISIDTLQGYVVRLSDFAEKKRDDEIELCTCAVVTDTALRVQHAAEQGCVVHAGLVNGCQCCSSRTR